MTTTITAIGEILWDVFAGQQLLGGATFNFAVNARRLGHSVDLLSTVGTDQLGAAAVATAARFQMYPQVTHQAPTGQVTVTVDAHGQPSYKLHRPAAYDFVQMVPQGISPQWIYFGTLHQIFDQPRQVTRQLLAAHPHALRFYDVNLRKDCYSRDLLAELLPLATVAKLNESEAVEISAMFGHAFTGLEQFCRHWAARHNWQTVCVTRGAHGCALLHGGEYLEVAGTPVTVVDAVGAGDAFSACLIHGLSQRWPLAQVGQFANRVGALVAGRAGGTPEWSISEVS